MKKEPIFYNLSHIREIPNSRLLLSLISNNSSRSSVSKFTHLELLDTSIRKGMKICSFDLLESKSCSLLLWAQFLQLIVDESNLLTVSICSYSTWSFPLGTWCIDMAYSPRRNLLGAISTENIAYHLFNIGYDSHMNNSNINLLRKSKRNSQYLDCNQMIFLIVNILWEYINISDEPINSLDFDPTGESIAFIIHEACLISDINTDNTVFHSVLGTGDGN